MTPIEGCVAITTVPFAFLLIYAVLNIIGHIARWGFRTTNIALRGWPPPHLDADGDWRPAEDDDE